MATLTGRTPASSHKDLLQVSNSNSGIDATLRDVSDGEGTAGAFQVSTTGVASTGTHRFDGVASSDDTTESTSTITGAIHTDGGFGAAKTIVAGLGIKLGGTAAANLLDDYEEGTFTPALVPQTSGTITLDTGFDLLSYTKVGDTVHVRGQIKVLSVSSPLGALRLTGLPFTSAGFSDQAERCGFYVLPIDLTGTVNVLQGTIFGSTTEIRINEFDGTTDVADVAPHMQATTSLIFNFSYPSA